MRAAAAAILTLSLALPTLARASPPHEASPQKAGAVVVPAEGLDVQVTSDGFVPADLRVRKGQQVVLRITRKTDRTCALDIVVPGLVAKTPLPLDKTVEVKFVAPKTGSIRYGCAMDQMLGGMLIIE